jgi:hypothetical protein
MSEEVYRGEPGGEIEIKVGARLPRGSRKSSRCNLGHRNFHDGCTHWQAGTRCLKRRKKGQKEGSARALRVQMLSQHEIIHGSGKGREEGEERRMGGTGNTRTALERPKPAKGRGVFSWGEILSMLLSLLAKQTWFG